MAAVDYSNEYAWDIDNEELVDVSDIREEMQDSAWEDFDVDDWVLENNDAEDLWDAIKDGKDFDEFCDDARNACYDWSYDRFFEEFDDVNDKDECEVDGTVYRRLRHTSFYL